MEIICSVIICSLVLKEIAAVATYCLAFQNLYVIITSEAANCSVIWNSVICLPRVGLELSASTSVRDSLG